MRLLPVLTQGLAVVRGEDDEGVGVLALLEERPQQRLEGGIRRRDLAVVGIVGEGRRKGSGGS